MTHSTRNQTRPSLSVRTRSSIHKTHSQMANRQGFPWKRIQMRLRNRITRLQASQQELSNTGMEPSVDSTDSLVSGTQNPLRSDDLSSLTQRDLVNCSSSSSSTSSDSTSGSACKWEGCGIFIEPSQLVTHIQQVHVLPQFVSCRRKCFSCLWRGCRVFRQPSVSAAWLEQHILHHTDAKGKPFRCIFDSCNLRFSTSILLERHVQRCHIRTTRARVVHTCNETVINDESSVTDTPNSTAAQPVTTHSPRDTTKLSPIVSTNGRKCLKRRRKVRCYRVRRVDFYDNRSRCVIQHRLKILRLLSRSGSMCLDNRLVDQKSSILSHLSGSPNLVLPKPLHKISSKPQLRSSAQPVPTSRTNIRQPRTTSFNGLDNLERIRNVAVLLTMPHTLIGQRLSNDRRTEFLVRCLGCTETSQLPPMWISEDHFKAAQALSEL